MTVVAGVSYFAYDGPMREKVIILVANYEGRDPSNYRVTDQVLSQLRSSLKQYDDTLVYSLDESITEQQGADKARALGDRLRGDLVVWGWYGATGSDVLLTVHIENLSACKCPPMQPFSSSNTYVERVGLKDIESFRLQQKLSDQMTSLTLLVGAIARFEAEDYHETIHRLDSALALGEWPELKSELLVQRGQAKHALKNIKGSIVDFDLAIQADAQNSVAYISRAASFMDSGEYQKAIDDLDQSLQIDPKNAYAPYARGVAYANIGQTERAITELRQLWQRHTNSGMDRLVEEALQKIGVEP
jgi:tetratricopeptide (TPR) repeat protein